MTKVEEGDTNAGDGEESVVRVDDELRTGVSQPQRNLSVVLVELLVFDNTVNPSS